ncbi:MAG: hypothetical protein II852_09005 [Bacteroidales bacterium]|nr:hypothetical protein [Bacteroidales bacterium]
MQKIQYHILGAEKRGLEAGIEQGRAEGRNDAMREIAIKAKAMGMSTAQIVNLTKLSPDEIERL